MNSKIALSGLSILAALTLVGGATFALFSDVASSQDNTFATGNADLVIAQGDISPGAYTSDIPAPAVSESAIAPGFTKAYPFWLKNNSTSAISLNLETTFNDVVILGGNAELANQLTAQFTCQSDTNNDGSLDTTIATSGTFTINQWDAGSAPLGTLGLNDGDSNGTGSDEARCVMTVNLPSSADNTLAGSSLSFDGIFNATQTP